MLTNLNSWADTHLAPNWRNAHWMWSLQLIIINAALEGIWMGWPAFQYEVPPMRFMEISIIISVAAAVSRLIKQSRFHDDEQA
jgi:hypothetical protein